MNQLPNLGGFTPSDLENMGMDFLLHLALTAASQHGVPPLGGLDQQLVNRTSPIENPLTLTADQLVNRKSRIVHRKPRSKASQLPPDIQLSLNTMLAGGCRYRDIIRCLNDQGHPGFNKVNLNTWKRTGFQDWLRSQPASPSPVTDEPVLLTGSNP